MLTITDNAAEAIRGIVASSQLPEGSGLRITSEVAEDDSGTARADLRLSLAEEPAADDQVAEGGQVFIESDTAGLLDGKQLDAQVSGEQVEFTLSDQG